MIKLTKKTEYGLIALKHIAEASPARAISAKEIAKAYHMPYPLLAKVLQALVKAKMLEADHGATGGYRFVRPPEEITLKDIVEVFEGPLGISACKGTGGMECTQWSQCNIRDPLALINRKMLGFLVSTTVKELCQPAGAAIGFGGKTGG